MTTQVSEYTWSLGNREVKVRRTQKPLGELRFDPRNQRIQFAMRSRALNPATVTEEQIYELLWEVEKPHVRALYSAIYEAGGLINPLIVLYDGTVLEGNLRKAALMKLCKDYPGTPNFCNPQCELPEALGDEERLLFLGDCHIAGKVKWDAYEKAEHLFTMAEHFNKSLDFLAKHLRMSKGSILQSKVAYQMHKEFLDQHPTQGNIDKFSYFLEFQKRRPLREREEAEPLFRQRFFRWVDEGKIPEGRFVRQLPRLLHDEEVLGILDRDGFKAAEARLQDKQPEDRHQVYRAIEEATHQLENLPVFEVQRLRSNHSAEAEKLRELYSRLKVVASLANIDLDGS